MLIPEETNTSSLDWFWPVVRQYLTLAASVAAGRCRT
jgi:hypothetical protein